MKENTLAPAQPADGQVTIKAVAADTKTLLDGTAVVWEAEDQIAVVLKGTETRMAEFTAETVADAQATFVGTVAGAEFETAYAVYPKTAFDSSEGKVSHELSATQTGVVTSGMNLSSALLDVAALKTGESEAEFHNALTLLQVVVPEGVNSVALTSSQDGLVGVTDFYVNNGVLTRTSVNTGKTVTLSTGSELAAGTYSLLVYPGNPGNLTLNMVGTDGTEFTKTVSGYTFAASKFYTVDLTKIFDMDVEETEYVSPVGGELEIDVVATQDYDFTVTTGASWISYVQTKAFNGKTIVLNVEANEGETRETTVTITWAGGQKPFKVVQDDVFMDIIGDQWEETFGVYATEADALAGANAKATYKNVFEIALSDDFSKGVYKITGMFKTDCYYYNGLQSGKGGEYYADYDAATAELTIKKTNAVQSYFFPGDVVLKYNSEQKTFAATSALAFSTNMYSSYNKDGFIGGYSVAVKVEEEGGDVSVNPLAAAVIGEYTESGFSGYPAPGTLVIEASDDLSKGDLLVKFGFDTTKFYAKVGGDANSTTITIAETSTTMWGSVSASLTFIPSARYIYGTVNYGWGSIYSYSAM